MNVNFKIIYVTNNGFFYYFDRLYRILSYDISYFYYLYININEPFHTFLPLHSYINCKEFRL